MPSSSPLGTALILQLLNPDSLERPEIRRDFVNNIFQHEYFTDFDWFSLLNQTITPPYIPVISNSDLPLSNSAPHSTCEKYTGDNSIFDDF